MILYVKKKNEDFTKTVLELLSEFSKVEGYKINCQKKVVFLKGGVRIGKTPKKLASICCP
jgi:hypothetical protein